MSTYDRYPTPFMTPTTTSTDPASAKVIRERCGIVSEADMAATLAVSKETLATWRTKKKGPPWVKIGKKVFYMLADFSKWVADEREKQNGRRHRVSSFKPRTLFERQDAPTEGDHSRHVVPD